MKFARAAVIGSTLLVAATFASPAMAVLDGGQDPAVAQMTILNSKTQHANGSTIHLDQRAQRQEVDRHRYITGGIGLDYFSHHALTEEQAGRLQELAVSRELVKESRMKLDTPRCDGKPVTTWTLKAGLVRMSVPTCDANSPSHKDLPVFSEMANIINSAE